MLTSAVRPARFADVFGVSEFRWLWLAEAQSVAGDQLARVALSVLVFDRTGSAGWTGLTYALTYLPDLVGGPLLAGLADLFPRRRVMVVADLIRAVLFGLMAVPAVPLVVVAGLLVVAQLCNAPFKAAQAATLPVVLSGDRYVVGQTVRQVTGQSAQLLGFAAGGVLVAMIGPHRALAVDAVTFALSALLLSGGVVARASVAAAGGTIGYWDRLTQGVHIVWGDRRLRSLVGLAWLAGFVIVPEGLAVPYAADIGGGSITAGVLLGAHPAGLALGALVVGRFVGPVRRLRLVGPLAVGAIVPLLAFGAEPDLPAAALLLMVSGACGAYQVVAGATFVRLVPGYARGQAFGLAGSGLIAVQGVGLVFGGLSAQALGSPGTAIMLAAAAGLLVGIPAAASWRSSVNALGLTEIGVQV